MALVGAVMAIALIVRRRAFRQTLSNLHAIIVTFGARTFRGWQGPGSGAAVTLDTPDVLTVPYGVAIALGAVTSWFVYGANPDWSLTGTLGGWLP